MKIIIETIPHEQHRYPTVGDWWFDADGSLQVRVSTMRAESFEFLVGIHEAIEAFLCQHRGVKEEDVTAFDVAFEKARVGGNEDEPGDDPGAPYAREHFFATSIERLIAGELGVDWQAYDQTIQELP